MKLKWRIKRWIVHWRQWENSIGDSIKIEKPKLSAYEEKGIKLFKLCLKDKEASLSFNASRVRQIEKDNLLLILQSSDNMYNIMTIIDINEGGKNLFELQIPKIESGEIRDLFDAELEKRMKKVQFNKRSIIEGDLDKLLKQEEAALKK